MPEQQSVITLCGKTYSAHQIQSRSLPPLPLPLLWVRWSLHFPPTDHHVLDRGSSPVPHHVQSSPLMTKAYPPQTSRFHSAVRRTGNMRSENKDSWRGFILKWTQTQEPKDSKNIDNDLVFLFTDLQSCSSWLSLVQQREASFFNNSVGEVQLGHSTRVHYFLHSVSCQKADHFHRPVMSQSKIKEVLQLFGVALPITLGGWLTSKQQRLRYPEF